MNVRISTVWFVALTVAAMFLPAAMEGNSAQPVPSSMASNLIPNGDFRQGEDQPAGWQLSGGEGRWVDREILEISATGEGSHYWFTTDYTLEPGKCYRFRARARRLGGSGGSMISGPAAINKDWQIGEAWTDLEYVFRAPENVSANMPLRLGHWQGEGTFQFDSVSLVPVLPVCVLSQARTGDVIVGEGESLEGGRYVFQGNFGWFGSNAHRTLLRATARFNSNRWVFSDGAEVVYSFSVPGCDFHSGEVSWNVNYHTGGTCVVEIGTSGDDWHKLGELSGVDTGRADLPAQRLPADRLLLRIRGQGSSCNFQVDQIRFTGELDEVAANAAGETHFAQVRADSSGLSIGRIHLIGDKPPFTTLLVEPRNDTATEQQVTLQPTLHSPDGPATELPKVQRTVGASEQVGIPIDVPLGTPGIHRLELILATADGPHAAARLDMRLHELFRADYGHHLSEGGAATLWWCEAPWKVSRGRPAPQADTQRSAPEPVRLSAARGDAEAVQVVVRAEREITGLTAAISDFRGPDGAVIPASEVDISRVYYHYVHSPTDSSAVRGWWPDALPPLDEPLDVPAEMNQPLWILVHVPRDAQPGVYQAELSVRGARFESQVPIALRVWGFALPERNHLATAFGLHPGNVFRYHGLENEEDRRRVLDMYFRSFAEHRISPYDPVPLDHYRVEFLPQADPPRAEIDFSDFDPAMTEAVSRYNFTHFRLPLQGMGGGTFHQRWEPSIHGFGEDTPEYQAMFSSYLGQLTGHLREKGWLPMAYAYWFDEPDPKDYEFVRSGMERLAKHGPGLARMLTEEPVEELHGAVDIWCPVTFNYDHEAAEARRAEGETFWWYVCTGPKAPYCTLFIDHPATELRVWLWQTWKYKVEGILVWQSNYWTSNTAFPERAQNPYLDPMGYVTGYSTPEGTKRHWGNGDGRFIYPPLDAATPETSDEPVIAPPVSSIRWEMLREGIEDYEMLYMLRELLAEKGEQLPAETRQAYEQLLDVPGDITSDMTTFTTDPRPILQRRTQVAEAIEVLSSL